MVADRVKVGVTGHRRLGDADAVRDAVERVLDGLDAAALEVWTSLAEGADRLVAHAVLDRSGGTLVAVLPLAADEYRDDFVTAESVADFDELLASASHVEVTGPDASGTRESAYERAGLAVLDGCDVLVAIWDGEPSRGRGGTAEIVDAARRRERPVVVVPVARA